MFEKKKLIYLIGTVECPLAVGCSAFIKKHGGEPFRSSAVKRYKRMPFGVTFIVTENTCYILHRPAKSAVREVRV